MPNLSVTDDELLLLVNALDTIERDGWDGDYEADLRDSGIVDPQKEVQVLLRKIMRIGSSGKPSAKAADHSDADRPKLSDLVKFDKD